MVRLINQMNLLKDKKKERNTEIWAQLHLSSTDCSRLRDFVSSDAGIKKKYILRKMHLTVYYSRRPLPGVRQLIESVRVVVPADETRFMVMTPGGENPRSNITPSEHMIGIRIHRQCCALKDIFALRDRLISHETQHVLGKRHPSSNRVNAFGSRWFQPHMVILRSGSSIGDNLSELGVSFRKNLGNLVFDKFEIKIVHRENMQGSFKPVGQS